MCIQHVSTSNPVPRQLSPLCDHLLAFHFSILPSFFAPFFVCANSSYSNSILLSPPFICCPHNSVFRGYDAMEIRPQKYYDEVIYPACSKMHRHVAAIKRLCLADYINEEMNIKLSEIFDLQHTLQDIRKKNCKNLANSMRQRGLYGRNEAINVVFENSFVRPDPLSSRRRLVKNS